MPKSKYERRKARRAGASLETNSVTVAGIRKRDKAGRQVGAAYSERVKPDLTRRRALLPNGKKVLAKTPEAGFPLGVYMLRGDLTREQFDVGQRFLADRTRAMQVLGIFAPGPKTACLDPQLSGNSAPGREPTPKQLERAHDAVKKEMDLKGRMPRAWRAFELCGIEELMGNRSERVSNVGAPEYRIEELKILLEELRKSY